MSYLIYDESQIKEFYNRVLGYKSTPLDVDFVCLFIKKELLEKEDDYLSFDNNYKTQKSIINKPDIDYFLTKVKRISIKSDYYFDDNFKKIPTYCMCIYSGVNHINSLSAISLVKDKINSLDKEFTTVFEKDLSKDEIIYKTKTLNELVMDCYRDPINITNKEWVDLDIDTIHSTLSVKDIYEFFVEYKERNNLSKPIDELVIVVDTLHGFHSILNKELYKEECKVQDIIEELKSFLLNRNINNFDIDINTSSIIPLPGTIQKTKKVKINHYIEDN